MLTGDIEEWENGYKIVTVIVQSNNRHFEYGHKIYLAPEKYSMWWLRKHRGNFGSKGSVSAEKNHSSVKNYLGTGSTLSIFANVKKLIDRHIQHNNERSKKSNILYVTSLSYEKSTFLGYLGKVNIDAKKVLSL